MLARQELAIRRGARAPRAQRAPPSARPPLGLQRAIGNRAMRSAATASHPAQAPPSVHAVLGTPGRALDGNARAFMEARFGQDFSGVRVHDDRAAGAAARAIGARAFTVGKQIAFADGAYRPDTHSGRRLLGHELTHVVQQRGSTPRVQRACDPALLAGRTVPVFFPQITPLVDVYTGARVLGRGAREPVAVGLVQQALVDLGHNLGVSGPRGDGVDRGFGSATETAISAFQTAEAIPGVVAGRLDEPTLRCLDEARAGQEIAAHQTGTVTPDQYRVTGVQPLGRDQDLFFGRGSAALEPATRAKIGRLATSQQGCTLTLEGFISEDELIDFGATLATDRLNAVDAEFAAAGHDNPGALCPAPVLPLRTHVPQPAASSGVSNYRQRRKVEVIPAGGVSKTTPCPRGSPRFRSLTATEATDLTAAIDQGRDWLNAAIAELTPGDPEGDAALTAYFGGTARRGTIRTNLETWRDHLDTVVRANNRHGTQCNAVCETATAFNNGTGASAQMTVCPPFFRPTLRLHTLATAALARAFVVMHEAGHGSIDTTDVGYGHRRLIEFLSLFPTIAETNTDSYTLMVLCLNGISALCSAPAATDTVVGLSAAEHRNARRGLAWLETWLTWASQDASSLYTRLNTGRETGQSVSSLSTYYASVFDVLSAAFDVRRPAGDPPPTVREQTTVAAIRDRLLLMQRASFTGLTIEKDTSGLPMMRWTAGGALGGPGRELFLTDTYFTFGNDRSRVQTLLPLILRATSSVTFALEPLYETFIRENVRVNRNNQPT